jgi:hypothetical protein
LWPLFGQAVARSMLYRDKKVVGVFLLRFFVRRFR